MRCRRCGKQAIIDLKYSGQKLCKSCFIEFFERRVRKTISDNKYLSGVKNIAIGLSGGKDSSSLLHILNKILQNKKISLIVITVDGEIKGYDDKLVRNAKKICKNLGLRHHIFSFKREFKLKASDLTKIRPGLCNCGIFKRYLLNKKARELRADKLAVGHNLDDELESILMNMMRGDVSRIIRGEGILKHEKFVPRIKPLQRSPENEVALYAKLIFPGFDFNIECPYRKDFLRFHVKKMIDYLEKNHPGIKYQIYEGNKKLRNALIKSIKIGKPNKCRICGEICSGSICQVCEFKEEIKKSLSRKR